MKWYSTKDHQPLLTCCAVLVAVHNKRSGNISLWLAEYDTEWKDWEHKQPIEDEDYTVLYFCYPDPIPKAYDDILSR